MKRWLMILWACSALGAGAEEFTYRGEPRREAPVTAWSRPEATQAVGDRLRVAAYNIEHFTDAVGDGPDRTPERLRRQAGMAAELLNEINPEVAVLMEIENATSLGVLNKALAKPYPVGAITRLGDGGPDEQKLNLAVLSRLPLAGLSEVDFGPLQGPGRPTRGFLRVEVELEEGHRLVVYAVHLKSNFGHRPRNVAQRQSTLKLIAEDARALEASDPGMQWEMLVAGDTNVDPEVPEFAGDTSLKPLKGWNDLWLGRPISERTTVPTRYGDPALEFPPACFDRLFASPALSAKPWQVGAPQAVARGVETQRVLAQPGEGKHISDHYPVYVDLTR